MLATRSLRLAASRYAHPVLSVWSLSVRTPPTFQATTIAWYTRPLSVTYSKDVKSGVLFSSSCSFLSLYRLFNTTLVNCTTCTIINSAPNTLESSKFSSSTPLTENNTKFNDLPLTSSSASSPDKPSSSSSVSKSTSPSASSSVEDLKTNTDKCSTGSLDETGLDVKLPSKDQVERFFFKSLVYLWDFTYYVLCLCRKLVETYVFNNSTVQQYWKQMIKRMDDARKEIKSK